MRFPGFGFAYLMSLLRCLLSCFGLVLVSGLTLRAQPAVQSLAGEWRFALDRSDAGVPETWFSRDLPDRITLPGVLQAQGFEHAVIRSAPPFDLVLANILPNTLMALAPAMRRSIRRGAIAVLSGILDHQAGEVRATYAAMGFRLLRSTHRDGWTALMLQRAR